MGLVKLSVWNKDLLERVRLYEVPDPVLARLNRYVETGEPGDGEFRKGLDKNLRNCPNGFPRRIEQLDEHQRRTLAGEYVIHNYPEKEPDGNFSVLF